jgi:hypothetical protein
MKKKITLTILALLTITAIHLYADKQSTYNVLLDISTIMSDTFDKTIETLENLSYIKESIANLYYLQQQTSQKFENINPPESQRLQRVFAELPQGIAYDFECIKGNIQDGNADGVYESVFGETLSKSELSKVYDDKTAEVYANSITESDITAKQGISYARVSKSVSDSILSFSNTIEQINQQANNPVQLSQTANLINANILRTQLLQLQIESQGLKTDAVILANQNRDLKLKQKQLKEFRESLEE